MNITIFTKNSLRHRYLIDALSKICKNLFVISENFTFNDRLKTEKRRSKIKAIYFNKVNLAEKKIFDFKSKKNNNVKKISINYGELSNLKLDKISDYLNSDYYIVFGSSFIKNDLINFLIKKKTINIHMGLSPYYRGSDCNFWALYDGNFHLVGGTVHLISKSLDSGPILFQILSKKNKNPYLFTMSAVKLTIDALVKKIKDKKLNLNKTNKQKKKLQIRYTRKSELTDEVIKKFMNKEL